MSRDRIVSFPCVKSAGRGRLLALGVLLLTALLFLPRLGDRALWSMELRWAEIPREMRLSDDYFRPTINGQAYYDKPLGSYWLVAAAGRLTGALDETAARLPCALCGLLAVALLMVVARRLYDARTAVLAGLILATSFSFVFFSRHASADVENVTGCLAALALFLRNEKRPDGWWVVGLWSVMALTSLTKGLLGFALPLLVLGVHCSLAGGWGPLWRGPLVERLYLLARRNRWLFNRRTPVAVALAAVVYLLPFVVSIARTGSCEGLTMVFRENLLRFFHAHNHRGPVYLYAGVLFGLLAPWSVLLPAALARVHAPAHEDRDGAHGDCFTRVWFWATFVFFTLSSSRRSYYLLPILPAAALLIARLLADPRALAPLARRLLRLGVWVFAVAVVASGVLLLPPAWVLPGPWSALPAAPARLWFGVGWAACVVGLLAALRYYRPGRVTVALAGSAYLLLAYVFLLALPATEAYRGERALAAEVRRRLGREPDGLALYRTREPVFYLDLPAPLPEYHDRDSLAAAARDGRVTWVLARRRELLAADLPADVVSGEPSFAWEAAEQAGNKVVLARLAATRGEEWPQKSTKRHEKEAERRYRERSLVGQAARPTSGRPLARMAHGHTSLKRKRRWWQGCLRWRVRLVSRTRPPNLCASRASSHSRFARWPISRKISCEPQSRSVRLIST